MAQQQEAKPHSVCAEASWALKIKDQARIEDISSRSLHSASQKARVDYIVRKGLTLGPGWSDFPEWLAKTGPTGHAHRETLR